MAATSVAIIRRFYVFRGFEGKMTVFVSEHKVLLQRHPFPKYLPQFWAKDNQFWNVQVYHNTRVRHGLSRASFGALTRIPPVNSNQDPSPPSARELQPPAHPHHTPTRPRPTARNPLIPADLGALGPWNEGRGCTIHMELGWGVFPCTHLTSRETGQEQRVAPCLPHTHKAHWSWNRSLHLPVPHESDVALRKDYLPLRYKRQLVGYPYALSYTSGVADRAVATPPPPAALHQGGP